MLKLLSHRGSHPACAAPFWLSRASLVSCCVLGALLWPPCVLRVLRYPDQVAPDPSVFVLMAPVPFVTMAMFACRPSPHEPLLGTGGKNFFFILNTANVLVAFLCAFQRRVALRRAACPFSPSWASLTFPLVSSCTVAVFYADEYRELHQSASWAVVVSASWTRVLVPLTLVVVPLTDVLWMAHLPNWFFCNPPLRTNSVGSPIRRPSRCALLHSTAQLSDQQAPVSPSPNAASVAPDGDPEEEEDPSSPSVSMAALPHASPESVRAVAECGGSKRGKQGNTAMRQLISPTTSTDR